MRYVILTDRISLEEIRSRQLYLYDIFKVYTIPFILNGIVELISVPSCAYDVVFINGHNQAVFQYLIGHLPSEKNIVLITCYNGMVETIKIKNKKIFYSGNVTNLLDGAAYGFNHDISNSELCMYNYSKANWKKRLELCFERKE